jgi:hypothetical protein
MGDNAESSAEQAGKDMRVFGRVQPNEADRIKSILIKNTACGALSDRRLSDSARPNDRDVPISGNILD